MRDLDRLGSSESGSTHHLEDVRVLVRLAPILMTVLAIVACDKEVDPELKDCQIATAKFEGILNGLGIEHEPGKTDDLQACTQSLARAEGTVAGASMKNGIIKVELEALGIKAKFNTKGDFRAPEVGNFDHLIQGIEPPPNIDSTPFENPTAPPAPPAAPPTGGGDTPPAAPSGGIDLEVLDE